MIELHYIELLKQKQEEITSEESNYDISTVDTTEYDQENWN